MATGRRPRLNRERAALLLALLVASCQGPRVTPAPAARSEPVLVGRARCSGCHAAETRAFETSHHARAMQPIAAHGQPMVSVQGGRDLSARYRIGVAPLQQYLVPADGGRLQVFELAWDTRPASAGGQRWFSPAAGAALQARSANWNGMCAACHATAVRKGYDAEHDAFDTRWSELDVSCEACHAAGSEHVRRAEQHAGGGFEAPLRGARAVAWRFEDGAPIARASAAVSGARIGDRAAEVNRCFPCHARRQELTPAPQPGARLLEDYAPGLIEAGLYHVDGQVDDEVFEYGAFAQSRMYAAGVTCSNCHDPHSGSLRASGDALCAQCHAPQHFAAGSHHHHAGAVSCVDCHMPRKTFMGVHVRHDHSLRAPRPDLSEQYGVPNPCASCHADRTAGWAAAALRTWGIRPAQRASLFARALDAGRRGLPEANALLAEYAGRSDVTPLARASALALLRGSLAAASREALARGLRDPDELVRYGAVRALDGLTPDVRLQLGAAALTDPVRAVRIEAARALADAPAARLGERGSRQLEAALADWFTSRQSVAERPETHVDIAQVHARRGELAEAERALRHAQQLEPENRAARVNLADLLRATGRDAEAEVLLRETVERWPDAAVAWHALGLARVRQGQRATALEALERASVLEPEQPDYAYVYALALHEAGRDARAEQVLELALAGRGASPQLRTLLLQLRAAPP